MNSRSFQIFIALSIPVIVIISVLLLISFEKGSTTKATDSFPYAIWSNTPKNCIGNTYSVDIEIDSQLARIDNEKDEGIVVLANCAQGPLPIYIPTSLETSVHPKQKFNAIISVNNNGSISAKALNKF